MTTRTVAVITAGLSQPSTTRLLADQLAAATTHALARHGFEGQTVVIELRDLAHDITNNLLTGFPSPKLQQAIEQVLGADGVIAVTPLYSGSYNGLFKSFFDVLDADALTGKPVLIAATGGTARHSLALEHAIRPLFSYLHAVVTPTAVFAATADWGTSGSDASALTARIERASTEFAALVEQSQSKPKTDIYSSVTPFEELLRPAPPRAPRG